uniref:Serpin domain-containing protein n=1 Tax=Arion vulgaris TaxID=1028688 RepID=A0A0B7A4I2_9EUPU
MYKQSLQYANNKFGLNLFKDLHTDSQDKNMFLSPISIQIAIAMTYIGARGKTADEIAVVMAWDAFDDTSVHKKFQEFFSNIQRAAHHLS